MPAEHGIAAVHHSSELCLLPEIYVKFAPASICHITRSLSTGVKAATNVNEPHSSPQLSMKRSRRFIFTSLSTLWGLEHVNL